MGFRRVRGCGSGAVSAGRRAMRAGRRSRAGGDDRRPRDGGAHSVDHRSQGNRSARARPRLRPEIEIRCPRRKSVSHPVRQPSAHPVNISRGTTHPFIRRMAWPYPARPAATGDRTNSRTSARPPAFDVATSVPTSSLRGDITGPVPAGARPKHRTGGGGRNGDEAESEPRSPEPAPEGGDFSMTTDGEAQVTPDPRSS